MSIELPQTVASIITALEQAGHQAYVVGGCVRDSIRGVKPKDWDICTSALPQQIMTCFKEHPVIETGLKHGTVTLILQDQPYEITTYRIDGAYSNGRHPNQVTFVDDLAKDLARRDFTLNAMAYNPRHGLVDPFGGRTDLKQRKIRAVGNADERFKEDALRIMRALRFASTLGFSLEVATARALIDNRQLLQDISAERIAAELKGILLGENAEEVLLTYPQVLAVPIPEIQAMVGFDQNTPYHIFDVWQHTVRSIVCAPRERNLRLTMLLHDIGKPPCYTEVEGRGHFYGHPQVSADMAGQILERLKLDKASVEVIRELVLYHDVQIEPQQKCIKRWLNRIGEEKLRQLLAVKRADTSAQTPKYRDRRLLVLNEISKVLDEVVQQQQCFSLKDLRINGNDLISVGFREGQEIGCTLDELLERVMNEDLENDRDALLEYALSLRARRNRD